MDEHHSQLIREVVAVAQKDQGFARAVRRALDDAVPVRRRHSVKSGQEPVSDDSGTPERRHRRAPAAVDVFQAYRDGGEDRLREVLEPLTVDQLKDIVAQHQMDRSRLAMKWRTPHRLIEHIVGHTINRAHKGEAFSS